MGVKIDIFGELKEIISVVVPYELKVVSTMLLCLPFPPLIPTATSVSDVHSKYRLTEPPTEIDCEYCAVPNEVPFTLTAAAPVVAKLSAEAFDMVGTLKLSMSVSVAIFTVESEATADR